MAAAEWADGKLRAATRGSLRQKSSPPQHVPGSLKTAKRLGTQTARLVKAPTAMQTARPGTFDGFFVEFVSCSSVLLLTLISYTFNLQVVKSFLSGLVTGVSLQAIQSWRLGKQ